MGILDDRHRGLLADEYGLAPSGLLGGSNRRDMAAMRRQGNIAHDLAQWARENPGEAVATAVSMSPAEPFATMADVGLSAKDVYDAVQKKDWWGAAQSGALGLASAAVPFLGYGAVKAMRGTDAIPMDEASRMARADKFKSNDLPSILDDLGYKYKVENSQFMSDRHGPSPSSYYTVETPLGTKRFRVSDHEDAAINPNQTYLFLGRDVNEQKKAAFDALGIAVPEDVADGVLATQAKRAELARARDAAETNRKMDAKSQIDDALNAFGAGHLTGRAKRQAIAALNMRSERRKKDTIAEILARNPPN